MECSPRLAARIWQCKRDGNDRSVNPEMHENKATIFGAGSLVGTLGGLIGLGGAEFRLPILIGMFRFGALEAVILNKAMSLVVVATALPFRTASIPLADVAAQWPVILNLLAGSLLGAWFGAGWAIKLRSASNTWCCWCTSFGSVILHGDTGDGRERSAAILHRRSATISAVSTMAMSSGSQKSAANRFNDSRPVLGMNPGPRPSLKNQHQNAVARTLIITQLRPHGSARLSRRGLGRRESAPGG